MMIRLAVFDLDGTLLNSLGDLADAVNYALEKNGFPVHPLEKYRYFVGDGVGKLVKRALPPEERTPENQEKIHHDFSVYYEKHFMDRSRPYDGMAEALDILANKGISLAVLSNKPDEFAKELVPQFFGERFQGRIFGNRPEVLRKPSPEGLLFLLESVGVSPAECVMIGDSGVDMQTSKNAGVHSIGCLWGFREKEELLEAGAEETAGSPWELPEIISKL